MLSKTAISCLGRIGVSSWQGLQCRLSSTSTVPHTVSVHHLARCTPVYMPCLPQSLLLQGVVREVLSLQLESGQAVQACVTFTQLNSSGGTQAAQVLPDKPFQQFAGAIAVLQSRMTGYACDTGSMASFAAYAERCQASLCACAIIRQSPDCFSSHSACACTAQGKP